MAAHDNAEVQHTQGHHGFPWKYVIGFILSLILTIIPLWMVLGHKASNTTLLWAVMLFAILQIFVQLFLFMHFTEGDGDSPPYHTITLGIGYLFTFIIVACSIWIMSFNAQAY